MSINCESSAAPFSPRFLLPDKWKTNLCLMGPGYNMCAKCTLYVPSFLCSENDEWAQVMKKVIFLML